MTLTCGWCGRQYEEGTGYGALCSRRCYDEWQEKNEQDELRRQQALDAKAREFGFANYAAFRAARKQLAIDEANAEVARLIADSNKFVDELAKYEDKPAPDATDIRKLAEAINSVKNKLPKNFGNPDDDKTFIRLTSHGLSCKYNLPKKDVEYLFGTFMELVHIHQATHTIKKENEEIKVSKKVTVYTDAEIHINDIVEFLMCHSKGIEDIVEPLLKKAEEGNASTESNKTIIYSVLSVLSAFCCYKFFTRFGSDQYGSFGGFILALITFSFAIATAGYRKKNIPSLIVSFILPVALFLMTLLFYPNNLDFLFFKVKYWFNNIFYETFSIRHAFSAYLLNMSLLASIFAIIPTVKNYNKKKFYLGKKLKKTDMEKASKKASSDRDGTMCVFLGVCALVVLFLANGTSINYTDGVDDNNFIWAEIFSLVCLIAPYMVYEAGNSIHTRPSLHIMVLIEFISFSLWSIPYFRTGHFIIGITHLIVAILALIMLIKLFWPAENRTTKNTEEFSE